MNRRQNQKQNQNQNQQNINELFVLPIGMEHVITLDGEKFYSSNGLRVRFIEAMTKTGRAKPIISVLKNLTLRESIIPCFTTKNLFQLVRSKWKHRKIKTAYNIIGFYIHHYKKIVLIMDANIKGGFETGETLKKQDKSFIDNLKWGVANDDWMAMLVIHEGMHKLALEQPSKFMSIFSSVLSDYYTDLFTRLLSLKSKPKEMDKVVKYIFYKVEHGHSMRNEVILAYYNFLKDTFRKYSTLNDEQFERVIRDYVVTWKIYSKSPGVLKQNTQKFHHILQPLGQSYKNVFGKSPIGVFHIQEIAFPSEVIAVRSEILLDSKTYRAFSFLK